VRSPWLLGGMAERCVGAFLVEFLVVCADERVVEALSRGLPGRPALSREALAAAMVSLRALVIASACVSEGQSHGWCVTRDACVFSERSNCSGGARGC
jgi:hypothetical protein